MISDMEFGFVLGFAFGGGAVLFGFWFLSYLERRRAARKSSER